MGYARLSHIASPGATIAGCTGTPGVPTCRTVTEYEFARSNSVSHLHHWLWLLSPLLPCVSAALCKRSGCSHSRDDNRSRDLFHYFWFLDIYCSQLLPGSLV